MSMIISCHSIRCKVHNLNSIIRCRKNNISIHCTNLGIRSTTQNKSYLHPHWHIWIIGIIDDHIICLSLSSRGICKQFNHNYRRKLSSTASYICVQRFIIPSCMTTSFSPLSSICIVSCIINKYTSLRSTTRCSCFYF